MAHIKNGESILEVAIGTGLTFREIIRANPDGQNVGIDLTPAMLEKAKSRIAKLRINNYQISVGDAYELKFPDRRFDLLMNNYMFDLLPEKDFIPVLKEFKRVLKPSGRIVIVNMSKGNNLYDSFREAIYRINPQWIGGCRGVFLSQSLQIAGFKNIYRETVTQMGFVSEIISATV